MSNVDYTINIRGHHKVYTLNMLKLYVACQECVEIFHVSSRQHAIDAATCVSVIDDTSNCNNGFSFAPLFQEIIQKETWRDVNISKNILIHYQDSFGSLLESFSDVPTDICGRTIQVGRSIKLTDDRPIRHKPYNVPLHYQESVKKEELLKFSIIEPSLSILFPYHCSLGKR